MTAIVHEIRARRAATPVLVQASEPVPGLRIYEQPEELCRPTETYPWRLGHHSGLVVAIAMYEDDIHRGAEKIADLADWTKPADELRAEVDGEVVYERISWASCEHPAYA